MTITTAKIGDLTPDENNANKGTERGRYALEKSLTDYGFGRSILIDKNGRIIAGNKTHAVAGEIGLEDVIVVQSDGQQVVAVQRTDLDISDLAARELAIADNRVGQLDLDWDADVLKELEEEGASLSDYWTKGELDAMFGQADELLDEGFSEEPAKTCTCPNCGHEWEPGAK